MKKQNPTLSKLIALSIFAAFSAPAMAQQAGDNIVNVGWFHVAPQDSSSLLTVGGTQIPNSSASISKANTVGISFTHFLTDNVGVSADLGIPPTMKLYGEGSLKGLGQVATGKLWSPAVLGKYYFGDKNSQFRPYVGAGISYVWYSNIKLGNSIQTLLHGPTSASLSSSFAPVANVGVSYNFDKNWSANFSVSYVKLKTTADLTTQTAAGTVRSSAKLTLDPIVTLLSVGYLF